MKYLILLLVKLSAVAILNFVFFILYPETGPYGNYYLWASISLWTFVIISYHSKFRFFKLLTFPLSVFLGMGIYLFMIFFISISMPQKDGISVFKKIKSGNFPNEQTIETGKIKYLRPFKGTFSKKLDLGLNVYDKMRRKED